jgi:hypothetical protein
LRRRHNAARRREGVAHRKVLRCERAFHRAECEYDAAVDKSDALEERIVRLTQGDFEAVKGMMLRSNGECDAAAQKELLLAALGCGKTGSK